MAGRGRASTPGGPRNLHATSADFLLGGHADAPARVRQASVSSAAPPSASAGISSYSNELVKHRYLGPGTPAPDGRLRADPGQNAVTRAGTWSHSRGSSAPDPQVPHGGRTRVIPGVSGRECQSSFWIGSDPAGSGGASTVRPGTRGPIERPDGHQSHFDRTMAFEPRGDEGAREHRGRGTAPPVARTSTMGSTLVFDAGQQQERRHYAAADASRADFVRETVDEPPRPVIRTYRPQPGHSDTIAYRHSGGICPPPDKVFRDREARQRDYEAAIPRYHAIERASTALVNTTPPRDEVSRRPPR